MNRSSRCLALAVGVLLAPQSEAQTPAAPPNPWLQLSTVTIHAGSVADYEDFRKKLVAGAIKIGAPQQISAYQLRYGGSGFSYTFVTPFERWGDQESHLTIPEIMVKAYGEAEAAKLLKTGRAAVDSAKTEVFRVLLNVSTHPKLPVIPRKYVSVLRSELNPGMGAAYVRYLGKIKAAEEKDPASPMVLREGLAYGEGSAVNAVRFSDTLGERNSWPNQPDVLRKAYGDEEAREMSEFANRAVAKRTQTLLVYRPDLSKPAAIAAR